MSRRDSARLPPVNGTEQRQGSPSKQDHDGHNQAKEGRQEAAEPRGGQTRSTATGLAATQTDGSRQAPAHKGRRGSGSPRAMEKDKGGDKEVLPAVDKDKGGDKGLPISFSPEDPEARAASQPTSFLALQPTPRSAARRFSAQKIESTPEGSVSEKAPPADRQEGGGRAGTESPIAEKDEIDDRDDGFDASFEQQLSLLAQQVAELSARLERKEREAQERESPYIGDSFDLIPGAPATRLPAPPRPQQRGDLDFEYKRMRQQPVIIEPAAYASRGRGGADGAGGWMEPQHPTVQCILAGYQETRQLLAEERRRRLALRTEYEKHLALLRKRTEQEKFEIKKRLLNQVDFLIRKYRRLAGEALAAAKRERARVEEERQAARKLAESACKSFEADLKERTKVALEQYRVLAQQAQKAAQEEKEQLTQKYAELEQSMDEERRQFDALIVQEAEDRVATVREAYGRLKQQLQDERHRYSQLMIEVQKKVELECELYEDTLVKGVKQLLVEKGVSDMEEAAVRTYLTAYREEQMRRNRRPGEEDRPITVKYGFQALDPERLKL